MNASVKISDMKTAILLGAGSSLPAGFPSTQSLTDRVLSGDGVWRHSDGTYFIDGYRPADETTTLVNSVIRRVHTEVNPYYVKYANRQANYEDVYYLADQMLAEESGDTENPAIHAFTTKLRKEIEPLASAASMDYIDLLFEWHNYVAHVVWRSLNCNANSSDHLKILEAACRSNSVSSISTLCHDIHVETYLGDRGISPTDGFSDEEAGVRYWHGDFSSGGKIPFLKLHGSVNWFRLRPDRSESWYDYRIGIPLSWDYQHTRGRDGRLQTALDGRPLLLIGTFNKTPDYTRGIFRELHHQFCQTLQKSDQLLVCGYSFGDKGINAEIIEWYYAERGRRLLIIHPNPEELARHARGAIQNKWNAWVENDGIRFIRKKLEDVKECELLGVLSK